MCQLFLNYSSSSNSSSSCSSSSSFNSSSSFSSNLNSIYWQYVKAVSSETHPLPSPPVPTVNNIICRLLQISRWPDGRRKQFGAQQFPGFLRLLSCTISCVPCSGKKPLKAFLCLSTAAQTVCRLWVANQPVPIKISRHCLVLFQTEAARQVTGDNEKE